MGNRTALFSRKQSGGVFTIDDIKEHPGDIFFVDSGHSAASDTAGFGKDPDSPFATIDYAVSQCTASQGDVIYAMPGHAETLAAAGDLDLDKIGLSLIGLGHGTLQPTVTAGTIDSVDIDIDAASVTIENIHFVSAIDDIVALIDVNATDFTIRNCRFTQSAADKNPLICIQDAAAAGSDRMIIEGCKADLYDTAGTHFVNFAGTGTGHIVRDNILLGDWGTMAIGGAGVVTRATIIDNVIYNVASDNDSCISFAATATGICMRNLAGGGAAQANGITATAMALAQNFYVDAAADVNAILEPVAT